MTMINMTIETPKRRITGLNCKRMK